MKKFLISLMIITMLMASVPAGVFAATTKVKTRMYEIQVVKNYAYTTGNKGIYRVKLKNGKPVSKKTLFKAGSKYVCAHLLVKGKYVYFKKMADDKEYLYRVKKTGGKAKKLSSMGEFSEVAFKGKKIYYTYPGETDDDGMVLNTIKKVMKLNGKDKQDTKMTAVEIDKYYNKKGYKFTNGFTKKHVKIYLKTPKGKIFLEKV